MCLQVLTKMKNSHFFFVLSALTHQEDVDSHKLALKLWASRKYSDATEPHLVGFNAVLKKYEGS